MWRVSVVAAAFTLMMSAPAVAHEWVEFAGRIAWRSRSLSNQR